MPIVQQVEVNVVTVDTMGAPVSTMLKFRNGEKCEFKKLVTKANGTGKVLLLPCNSFWVYWKETGVKHKQRVMFNYSDQREGTPFNHKKIGLTLVTAQGGIPEFIWFAEDDYNPV